MALVILVYWMAIYPVDSAIQILNNWGQYFHVYNRKCAHNKRLRDIISTQLKNTEAVIIWMFTCKNNNKLK